ncbi:hypothetical protein [Yoonia litorea]|uniref:Lipoprotein n=1 Tax=Yoonia litorea TaxID=1123755 RepID=A0A1I6L779_9RHOB|nr:hypothetical protein [Yoonia litorea]SFR99078.1 hypothetical protein SAMN05444714_0240 [Yoonia litorea]
MRAAAMIMAMIAVSACAPISPERAADRCEDRARAAQGPEIGLRMGANSESGPFAGGSISISSDAIMGRDPVAVYEECVFDLTGELPIRPPRLRDI